MTTARTSGSRASFNASRRPAWSARLNAFITSGRLSVIVWTAPSRVDLDLSHAQTLLLAYAPSVELERHELEGARWEVARRVPSPVLRPLLGQALEGWTHEGFRRDELFRAPVPRASADLQPRLTVASRWRTSRQLRRRAGPRSTAVAGERTFSCLELQLTPLGARPFVGFPLHELAEPHGRARHLCRAR